MKSMNRRTVLQGLGGIAVGLPWLEATAQSSMIRKNVRLAYLIMPNGVDPDNWTPSGKGSAMKLSKSLAPLEQVKGKINVHTGLGHPVHCGHNPGFANFLSGIAVKKGTGEFGCAITADQLAAKLIGQNNFLPSLELSLARPASSGLTNSGYNKTLGGYMSWTSAKVPASRELIPVNAYNRLFKGAKKNTSTAAETKSILDYIKEDTIRMKRSLGREDVHRIDQYFHSVRSLEVRLQKLASDNFTMPRDAKKPQGGIPRDFDTYAKLMLDIIVLAFQTNRTKIASLMFGRAVSGQKFDFLPGVSGGHHQNSHHAGNKTKKGNVEKITRYHVSLYSYMLQKMDGIKEGDKTLLDNSLVLFGSGMWDGERHNHKKKPLVVGGKGGGKVKTGQHIVNEGTRMNNLLLGMMQTAGCPIKKFGDSTGSLI